MEARIRAGGKGTCPCATTYKRGGQLAPPANKPTSLKATDAIWCADVSLPNAVGEAVVAPRGRPKGVHGISPEGSARL